MVKEAILFPSAIRMRLLGTFVTEQMIRGRNIVTSTVRFARTQAKTEQPAGKTMIFM